METKTITVDYTLSLQQMISLGGNPVAMGITPQRFPLPNTGKLIFEPRIFSFTKEECYTVQPIGWHGMYTEDVIRRMATDGFRPAKIEELLAYWVAFKQDLPKGLIAALEAKFFAEADEGHLSKFVAILVPDSNYVTYHHCEIGWTQGWNFLGVREVQPKS